MSEAHAIIEPAATRIRDPLSGRSIWMAGLIDNASIHEDALSFSLVLRPEHTAEDGARMRTALLTNIQDLGFGGTVKIDIREAAAQTSPQKAAPQKDPVPGMSGGGTGPHGGPS